MTERMRIFLFGVLFYVAAVMTFLVLILMFGRG